MARRILVAEDDEDMRTLVAEALRREGYDVHSVAHGIALRDAVCGIYGGPVSLRRPLRWDLIVSDVRMPGFTGTAMLEELRDAGDPTPILLMTAFGDDELRDAARALGARLFDKPFEMSALREVVSEILA